MATTTPAYTADSALARLVAGNERFVRGEARFPTVQKEILAELAREQRPYATVVGCSDSRVPPELIFDAGFGELFIVRVAGNVISPEVKGSSPKIARASSILPEPSSPATPMISPARNVRLMPVRCLLAPSWICSTTAPGGLVARGGNRSLIGRPTMRRITASGVARRLKKPGYTNRARKIEQRQGGETGESRAAVKLGHGIMLGSPRFGRKQNETSQYPGSR